MLSFEEEEEGGESLEELEAADSGQQPSTSSVDALNDNNLASVVLGPTMVRLKSTDSDNNIESLSRRLDLCWRDAYYDANRENEEKIYEDLCYITFSSSLQPEVVDFLQCLPVPTLFCYIAVLCCPQSPNLLPPNPSSHCFLSILSSQFARAAHLLLGYCFRFLNICF